MRRALASLPGWARLAVLLFLLIPFALSVTPAYFVGSHDPFGGLVSIGGVIGVAVASRFRNPDYWKLEPVDRRRVQRVRVTGRASGDDDIDAIAASFLRLETKNERSNRIALPLVFLAIGGTPVVAAFRDSRWWLLAAMPGLVLAAGWFYNDRTNSASLRLSRLEAVANPGTG